MRSLFRTLIVSILTLEAALVLRKYRPKLVVVTGSVGKTSTKDAIYTVLSPSFYVRKSEKSYNSDIGVPLTVLGCPNGWGNPVVWMRNMIEGLALIFLANHYPRVLVLEVGADRPGDIRALMAYLSPDIVVATRFPDIPVHVEFFASPEAVRQEELLPLLSLAPGAVAIVNADDAAAGRIALPEEVARITYGSSKNADFSSSHERITVKDGLPAGISFKVSYQGSSAPVALPGVVGDAHVSPVLAALCVGHALGLNLAEMAPRFAEHQGPPGRMRLIEGKNSSVIIDDTYNSSPVAVVSALDALEKMGESVGLNPAAKQQGRPNISKGNVLGRKVAILGDMLELGRYSVDEHKRVGAHAARTCDLLFTVGVRSRDIAVGAKEAGLPQERINLFDDARHAADVLRDLPIAGDCILVKGSQSVRLERVVEALMAHPEDAEKLLARQEREWKGRLD
jgi:UDP-N-acetylmuramyl pentapeptide synthase